LTVALPRPNRRARWGYRNLPFILALEDRAGFMEDPAALERFLVAPA